MSASVCFSHTTNPVATGPARSSTIAVRIALAPHGVSGRHPHRGGR